MCPDFESVSAMTETGRSIKDGYPRADYLTDEPA